MIAQLEDGEAESIVDDARLFQTYHDFSVNVILPLTAADNGPLMGNFWPNHIHIVHPVQVQPVQGKETLQLRKFHPFLLTKENGVRD